MTIRGQISLAEATLAPRIGSFWALPAMYCENVLLTNDDCAPDEFILVIIIGADLASIELCFFDHKE